MRRESGPDRYPVQKCPTLTDLEQSGTPTRLNVSQAAKAVGRSRSTLNRDIDNGTVSVTRNGKGQPFIEIAELERVYGKAIIRTVTQSVPNGHDGDPAAVRTRSDHSARADASFANILSRNPMSRLNCSSFMAACSCVIAGSLSLEPNWRKAAFSVRDARRPLPLINPSSFCAPFA